MVRGARLSLALLCFALPGIARAEFSLGLLAADTYTSPSASQPQTSYQFTSKASIGGGLLAQFNIAGAFGLQLGFLLAQRKYAATVTATNTGVTTVAGDIFEIPVVELPLFVTFAPASWLSFGAGAYYGVVIDHVEVTDSGGGGGIAQSLADTQLTNQDYGLAAELRLLFPLFSLWGGRGSLWLEGQYLYGLANSAVQPSGGGTPNTYHYRDAQILGGFAIAWF